MRIHLQSTNMPVQNKNSMGKKMAKHQRAITKKKCANGKHLPSLPNRDNSRATLTFGALALENVLLRVKHSSLQFKLC